MTILSDDAMAVIDELWDAATPEEKLQWFNGMAVRPSPPMAHWREILDLANHFAERVSDEKIIAGINAVLPTISKGGFIKSEIVDIFREAIK